MKVAVTGVAGFIGSWLVRDLVMHGHDVVGMDLVATEHYEQGDLLEPGLVERWLDREQPDVCYHLAAQIGRLHGEDDPMYSVRENSGMTAYVARACGERGIRLAYTSSSEIYGDQGDRLILEEDAYLAVPHNIYGLTKRHGEEVSRMYAPDRLVIVRPNMPYGPGVPPGRGRRALDTFLWWAHTRQVVQVHRGAARCWTWVGDLVAAMRLAIECQQGGTYNIGNAEDEIISMLCLAEKACDLAGASRSLIEVVDPPVVDPGTGVRWRQTPVKRISSQQMFNLGWRPRVTLDQGMPEVYQWIVEWSG